MTVLGDNGRMTTRFLLF